MTRIPEHVITKTFDRLMEIGWVEAIGDDGQPVKSTPQAGAAIPQPAATAPHLPITEWNGMEEKRTEDELPPAKPAVRIEYSSDFEDWWKVYPRRESKGYAQKKFSLAIKGLSLVHGDREKAFNWLMMRTRAYANSPRGKGDKQFIPHPATWLEGRKFDDDEEVWRNTGGQPAVPISRVATKADLENYTP